MRKRTNAKKTVDKPPCCFIINKLERGIEKTYICTRPLPHFGRHVQAKYITIPSDFVSAEWIGDQIDKGTMYDADLPVIYAQATNSKDYGFNE